ncbi:MAG: hypothetical protein RLZZ230_219 [Candidatus Parcubacteria bacterium]
MYHILGYQIDVIEVVSILLFLFLFEAVIYINNYSGDDENHFLIILFLSLFQLVGVVFWSVFF